MNKIKIGLASLCLLMLPACSINQSAMPAEITVIYVDCPPVPPCVLNMPMIKTNGDLAMALGVSIAAFQQCKLARNVLQQCVDTANKGMNSHD